MTQQDRRSAAASKSGWSATSPQYAWVALGVVIAAVWANSVMGGPIFDDYFLVVREQCFRSWRGIVSILQLDAGACTYRPARYLSYGTDYAVFGGAFWGFHVGNIVRHVVAAFVVGGFVRELASRTDADGPVPARWFAFAVAAAWALHPVQTDSVSYVSGRRDILAGLWTFGAVWSALVADRRGGLWWLVPLWCTLFGFLSKESAVVVPVLFLLWKVHEVGAGSWLRENLSTAVSVFVGLVLSFLLVLYRGVFASHSHMVAWWGGSAASNFATVAVLQVYYVRHVFLGAPLIGDYKPETIPLAASFGDPRAVLGMVLVASLVALAWAVRRRRPLVTYGIGWYLVALAPVSHVFPHHELFAEHYLYIPLLGAVIAVVDGVCWAVERSRVPERWSRIAVGSGLVLMVVAGLRIVDRNRDFRDERAFYEHVVEHAPNNLRAVANLGNIYFDLGEWDLAVAELGSLSDRWTPGSRDELRNTARLLEAAVHARRRDVVESAAARLVANHTDVGLGHRWTAQLAAGRGDHEAAFASAVRWFDLTLDPAAAGLAVGAWHAGRLGPASAAELARVVRASPENDPRAARGAAAALRDSYRPAEALSLLLDLRPDAADAAYDDDICATAALLDSPPALPYCPAHAPLPPD